MQLAPSPAGEGPLLLPAPADVEAELAALAAVAALKAEGNACAPRLAPATFIRTPQRLCCVSFRFVSCCVVSFSF